MQLKNTCSKKLYGGIDPGKKGAIAFVSNDLSKVLVFPMPELEKDLIPLLSPLKKEIVCISVEKQQPFPEQGISSTFKLARHYGIILGILKTLNIPHEEVPPQKWKKFILGNCKGKRKLLKKLALEKASSLFPSVKLGKHDGKADALLLALYTLKTYTGESKK